MPFICNPQRPLKAYEKGIKSALYWGSVSIGPLELKLQFFCLALPFVLDVEHSRCRHLDAFSGHMDGKWSAGFDAVGQPPQLGHGLLHGIGFLHVTIGFFWHVGFLDKGMDGVWFQKHHSTD